MRATKTTTMMTITIRLNCPTLVTRNTVFGPHALDRPDMRQAVSHSQSPAQDRTLREGGQAKLLASIFSANFTVLPRLLEPLFSLPPSAVLMIPDVFKWSSPRFGNT